MERKNGLSKSCAVDVTAPWPEPEKLPKYKGFGKASDCVQSLSFRVVDIFYLFIFN